MILRGISALALAALASAPAARAEPPFDAKAAYALRCAMCHGATGGADGPAGVALRPAPRKFSDKAVMDALTDEQLFASIKEGRPGTPMVAFRATLADDEIRALIAYIRTMAK